MARPLRVEFPEAVYHVMSRGNGGADIFLDDEDRRMWVQTLGRAAMRCGWEVHAWVLMGNHYHALIGTPEPNLVDGMRWLQQVFTQAFNRRHNRRGHVLQGRYKAQLVEGGPPHSYLCTAADYIHLNPARAQLLGQKRAWRSLADYPWSSLRDYRSPESRRPAWLRVERVLVGHDYADTHRGRCDYLCWLEKVVSCEAAEEAAISIRHGWILGSASFAEQIAKWAKGTLNLRATCGVAQAARRCSAQEWLDSACRKLDWRLEEVCQERKLSWRKGLLAWWVREKCVASNAWLAKRLKMGHPTNVSRASHQAARATAGELRKARLKLKASLT